MGATLCVLCLRNQRHRQAQASLPDLHPGQRLEINYEDAQGVLVAHQIAQHNVTFTGHVKTAQQEQKSCVEQKGKSYLYVHCQ
jgi:hypothetical protein